MCRISVFLAAILLVFLSVDASAQSCDSLHFEVSAELTNDPGFEGLYKYTITGYWEVSGVEEGGGLSYLLLSLGEECPCLCDSTSDAIYFPDPAGTSTGVDDFTEEPCEAQYTAGIECNGLEDITDDDVIKYEAISEDSCQPIDLGSGTWVFYSTLAPLPWREYTGAVMIKYGEMMCTDGLSGQLPSCYECVPVPTERRSWGAIKALYD